MVHALSEIRRVLVPKGILIDLRPVLDNWKIDVASSRSTQETGRVTDTSTGLADDHAANQSMAQAELNGWFKREREEYFPFYYSWDSATEMEEWITDDHEDFMELDDTTLQATRSAWALSDADSRVRVQVKMLISKWQKQ